jgi:hypothetical protein
MAKRLWSKLALPVLYLVGFVAAASMCTVATGQPASKAFQEFEISLTASLPRCFPTTDHTAMAEMLTVDAIRCEPRLISFGYEDPLPTKIVCMAKENFRPDGNAMMLPPLLILTVEHNCVTKKNRH